MDHGMEIVDLGLCEYPRAYEIQKQTVLEKEKPILSRQTVFSRTPASFYFWKKK